jgi:hypothetical protein
MGDGKGDGDAGTQQSAARPAVSEEIEWRGRAVQAEERLRELEEKLAAVSRELEESRAALDASERRRQIERELVRADALDLETAVMLTEAAVSGMDEPDVASAVSELRRRKPFLFRAAGAGVSAMGAGPRGGMEVLDGAASAARASGERGALLRYLRLKRGA